MEQHQCIDEVSSGSPAKINTSSNKRIVIFSAQSDAEDTQNHNGDGKGDFGQLRGFLSIV